MKKLISLLLMAALVLTLFAGCGGDSTTSSYTSQTSGTVSDTASDTASDSSSETEEEPVTIRIGGLKGPTSIGMVKLMEDDENGETENDYEFTLAGAAGEISPLLASGELDIIAAPVNLASVLYNNTDGQVRFAAVNTLGVLYVVQKGGDPIESIADLEGKTIYATGQGQTPEYSLRYLLTENGLDPDTDVTIEFKSEPTEVVALMNQQETAIAMLPQPFVTVAQNSVEGLEIALDLTEEWDKLDNGTAFVTAGLIVRADFIEQYPQQFEKFMEEYAASTEYANENVADAAALCEKFDIIAAAVAETAIPYCNITCITGEEMKTMASAYLEILFEQDAESVGGALPDDDLYYVG